MALLKCLVPIEMASPTGVFSWASLFWSYEIVSSGWTLNPTVAMIPPESTRGEFPAHYALFPRGAIFPEDVQARRATLAPPEAAAVAKPKVSKMLPRALTVCWLIGSGLVIASLWKRWRRSLVTLRNTVKPRPDLSACCNSVRRRLGLSRRVAVRVSQDVGPVSFGVWRPSIILPSAVAEGPRRRLELVLAHELMHLKRSDPLLAWLQVVSQVVWWFHPLVWWLNRRVCDERERACDEQVLREMECSPAEYARCLLEVVELRLNSQLGFAFAAMPAWGLKQRFEQVLSAAVARRTSVVWTWLAAVSLAALVLPGSAPSYSLPLFAPPLQLVWRAGEAAHWQLLPHTNRLPGPNVDTFRQRLTRRIGGLELVPGRLSIAIDRKSAVVKTWRASFAGQELSPAEFAALAELPAVTSLYVEVAAGGDADRIVEQLATCRGLPSLREFSLTTRDSKACDLIGLGRWTELKQLYLDCPGFTDRGLLDCQGLVELETLYVGCPDLSDAGLTVLGGFPSLTTLMLECPQLTDKGAAFLSQLTQLRTLHLGSGGRRHVALGKVTDETLQHLRGASQLRYLKVFAPHVTGEGLAWGPGRVLGSLTVDGRISAEGWRAISELQQLRELKVRSPVGSEPHPQILAGFPELFDLSLDQVIRSDASLPGYAELPNLHALLIHRSKVSQDAVQWLQKGFKDRGHKKKVVHYFDSPPGDW
ncbi:MAG: M56 family metallopeptidase [Pirellulales bacterium]